MIENALLDIPGVLAATVLATELGDSYVLSAAIVPVDGEAGAVISKEYLYAHIRRMLPDYMIPHRLVIVDSIPIHANGKLDLQQLEQVVLAGKDPKILTETSSEMSEACTDIEEIIIEIWQRYLDVPFIRRTDNFFALGGDSLSAIQSIAALQSRGLEVSPEMFLENSTVQDLAVSLSLHSSPFVQQERVSNKYPGDLVPIQPQRFFAQKLADTSYWDQAGPGRKLPTGVFLTGATGYVGIYLLRQLLRETSVMISCLVRADNINDARSRLLQEFKWYFPCEDLVGFEFRVRVYAGDITKERLGLLPLEYDCLCRTIDMIFHCAADVRLFGTYEELQKVNIKGTCNILQFAEAFRMKEVHYLSTLNVAGRSVPREVRSFSEDDLDYGQEFLNYYERTKFQGEKLMKQYMEGGGHGYIYRLGSISAPVGIGRFQRNLETNHVVHSLRGYILSKLAPDLPDESLILSQVDVVVRGIVAIALAERLEGGTFHVASQTAVNHNVLIENLIRLGFDIQLVRIKDYIQVLSDIACTYSKEAALAMIWAQRGPRNVIYDCQRSHNLLVRLGVSFPRIDSVWLAKLIQHCLEQGFIGDSSSRYAKKHGLKTRNKVWKGCPETE